MIPPMAFGFPANNSDPNPYNAKVHRSVHSGTYYETVNERMRLAKSEQEVLDILADIRADLLAGRDPSPPVMTAPET
jgi:hypothetical protein